MSETNQDQLPFIIPDPTADNIADKRLRLKRPLPASEVPFAIKPINLRELSQKKDELENEKYRARLEAELDFTSNQNDITTTRKKIHKQSETADINAQIDNFTPINCSTSQGRQVALSRLDIELYLKSKDANLAPEVLALQVQYLQSDSTTPYQELTIESRLTLLKGVLNLSL